MGFLNIVKATEEIAFKKEITEEDWIKWVSEVFTKVEKTSHSNKNFINKEN